MKTNYPDSLTIQQYLDGKLDPEVAHQLEKQALDDPFLWDALEGYSTYRDPAADLSILQRQLHERIVHLQENKKVFDLSWQRLSVAAAAAVMFVSAGILFWMNSNKSPEKLASASQKPVEVNIIDRDSVEAVIKSKDEPVIASLGKKEEVLNRLNITATKPANTIVKKAIISPEAEIEAIPGSESLPEADRQGRTMSSASVTASRLAKSARIEGRDATLNDIVVKGQNNPPKSGWLAYREYLELKTSKFKSEPALKGSVILSFQILSDGRLSNIKVVKGLNDAYDQEALRIVRIGSDWSPSSDGKPYTGSVEVIFK